MPGYFKKALPVIIALFAASMLLTSTTVSAQQQQDSEAQKLKQAQQDYTYQFSKYDNCHSQYVTDRSTYLTYQTAISKNNAFLTTKKCLTQVYNVYIAYLRYIKEQGNTFTWNKNDLEKDAIFKTLDEEIAYFQNNQDSVNSLQTLEDTVPFAANLKSHISSSTYPVIEKALATYYVAESEAALESFDTLSAQVRDFVTSRVDQKQYGSFLANWDSEIADVKTNCQNYNAQARKSLDAFHPSGTNSDFGDISTNAKKTITELSKSKDYLTEILKIV